MDEFGFSELIQRFLNAGRSFLRIGIGMISDALQMRFSKERRKAMDLAE